MPNATVSTKPERKELKSLPGAYVVLRQLPYGDWLYRNDIAMAATMEGDKKDKDSVQMQMKMMNAAVTRFEFSECILEHNLEDGESPGEGQQAPLLNFKTDGLAKLDPRVGQEVSDLINELHEFDEGNSPSVSSAA